MYSRFQPTQNIPDCSCVWSVLCRSVNLGLNSTRFNSVCTTKSNITNTFEPSAGALPSLPALWRQVFCPTFKPGCSEGILPLDMFRWHVVAHLKHADTFNVSSKTNHESCLCSKGEGIQSPNSKSNNKCFSESFFINQNIWIIPFECEFAKTAKAKANKTCKTCSSLVSSIYLSKFVISGVWTEATLSLVVYACQPRTGLLE